MKNFDFLCGTRIVFDNNMADGLKNAMEFLDAKKAFVVTDPGLAKLPIFSDLQKSLNEAGYAFEIYTDVRPNPKDVTMTDCAEHLKKSDADVVIGFGGGSSVDTAKAAAILKTNDGKISDYYGVNTFKIPPMPVIAIPTTAGAGAEASTFISITDTERNTKAQIASPMCTPRIAILCPHVLKGSPRSVTTTAGFDALAHAIESYINRKSSPITEPISLKAFELIANNLYRFVNDTADTEAASNMILGSTMAIMSAGYIGVGDAHSISRSIGGTFDINHGTCIAITLPHVLNFNIGTVTEKLANCARAMGIDTTGMSDMDAAKQCILAIQKLREDLEMPGNFKELGMTKDRIDDMAERTMWFSENGSDKDSAPRKATMDEYKALYDDVYVGKVIQY